MFAALRDYPGTVYGVALSANGALFASGGGGGSVNVWSTASRAIVVTLRAERRYERMDITGLTGITPPQREAMLALGAIDRG